MFELGFQSWRCFAAELFFANLKSLHHSKMIRYIKTLLLFSSVICVNGQSDNDGYGFYPVITFDGQNQIKNTPSNKNPFHVYCYGGCDKTVFQTWKSAQFVINISSDNFQVYRGTTPKDVHKAFKEDTWIQSIFFSKSSRSFSLDPFTSSCLGIKTSELYDIRLNVQNADNYLIAFACIGLFLYIYSKTLAENTLFFYLCGITTGVLTSFLILVYFLGKFLPGKPIIYSALAGCTIGVYMLQLLWSNFKPLLFVYYDYVLWYTVITAFISFIVCYKIGPPKDKKSKNIISWILQICGITLIYFSTYIFEVFCSIVAVLIIIKIFPRFIITALQSYWRKKFPSKRVLLTQEEYYIQGQVETAKALDELRGYCSSPECKQWKLMLSLKDPQRFANFIENRSHISSDEIDEYESSEFVLKKKNLTKLKSNKVEEGDLISEDSSASSSDDDEY